MKRTMPLKADPVKTAAFNARGRAFGLKQTDTLKRGVLRPGRPRRRAVTPPDIWQEVYKRDGGRCVWCGSQAGTDATVHHLLPKSLWPIYVGARGNMVLMDWRCHSQHEFSPRDRLPWAALPAECKAFLIAVAKIDPRVERLIETKYPADADQSEHPVRRGRHGD